MLLKELIIFDLLATPVWVVHPFKERILYGNQASRALSGDMSLDQMRKGTFSTCPEVSLQNYLYYFKILPRFLKSGQLTPPTARPRFIVKPR
ncbi:Probable diguanylate cyclase YdaM [Raoultella terrigena]|uniref:Probable diguanylate cyclase YdaM n=1 Tax=Raoultella terrigena TaxID=577 RepID=A0A3P8IZ40_RAOTE|nr:Probable diguanylate cyclase YdaM [Raoultella terrigena]